MALRIGNIIVDGLTTDPVSPENGQTWYRSDLGEWRVRKNGQTKKLASRGTGAGDEDVPKCNVTTSDPTATDDANAGYTHCSLWINSTTGKVFVCQDETATAAIWIDVTAVGGGDPTDTDVTATALTTTTSTGYVVLDSMTLTPVSGTYRVLFFATMGNTDDTAITTFAVHKAGTIVADSERFINIQVGATDFLYTAASTTAKVTVNGSEAIDIRWKVNGNTGRCYSRSLVLIKVA